jgi:hypothetical protein
MLATDKPHQYPYMFENDIPDSVESSVADDQKEKTSPVETLNDPSNALPLIRSEGTQRIDYRSLNYL